VECVVWGEFLILFNIFIFTHTQNVIFYFFNKLKTLFQKDKLIVNFLKTSTSLFRRETKNQSQAVTLKHR